MGCLYKGNSIAVIIPCINEERGIERVLRAVPEFVDQGQGLKVDLRRSLRGIVLEALWYFVAKH